jgi:transcriptional regulator with XRE-family HTH domain
MPSETNKLSQTITELMRAKGVSLEKLASLTGVSERHIQLILDNKLSKLPAAPYARGYLNRISGVLGLDSDHVWQEYLAENAAVRQSGKDDKMPQNRFIFKRMFPRATIAISAILIVVIIATVKTIATNNPRLEFHNLKEDITIVKDEKFTIKGDLNSGYKLTLNDNEIFLGKGGSFEKEVLLEPGFNTFVFKAKKVLGRERVFRKQIFYDVPEKQRSPINLNSTSSETNGTQEN